MIARMTTMYALENSLSTFEPKRFQVIKCPIITLVERLRDSFWYQILLFRHQVASSKGVVGASISSPSVGA